MLKLLGILDFLAALTLLGFGFWDLDILGWIFAIYLIGKGLLFFNWLGTLDIISGILLILAIFNIYNVFNYFAIVWLAQKAIFSFLN